MLTPQQKLIITETVDKHINYAYFSEGPLSMEWEVEKLPEFMIDYSRPTNYKSTATWKIVPSEIDDELINEVQKKLGMSFPPSYVFFIKYIHFPRLCFYNQIEFFDNLPQNWAQRFGNFVNDYPDLLGNKVIPFAYFVDTGIVGFDTNAKDDFGEYPVIYCDHEYDFEYKYREILYENFYELMKEAESKLQEWIDNDGFKDEIGR